jgi:branched-chain amino acid transport system substrate-binding protein
VQARASLRAPDGSAPVPPLAIVNCNESDSLQRAATHLAVDLRVPALIGCASSKDTLDLAASLFVPNDVLTVAPRALTPMLRDVPHLPGQPRMVWRTTYDNTEAAAAIAAMVRRFDTLRTTTRPMRLALTRRKDTNQTAFAEAFFETLRFNGRSALENGDAYREFSFPALSNSEEDRRGAASAVAAFAPDVIVVLGNSGLIAEIEGARRASSRPPTYILPYIIDDDALRFVGTSVERRRRVFGLTTVSTTRANARFVLHYNETFPEPITRTWAPNSTYDAFYLIAYAAYAARSRPTDGRALASSIARLLGPGSAIEVGAASILGAFDALNRGKQLDLNGATGSMDFDPRTGEAPVDLAILCASVDAKGAAADAVESGLVFDAKTGELVNEPSCP